MFTLNLPVKSKCQILSLLFACTLTAASQTPAGLCMLRRIRAEK